ncbi:DEAD/DEAH box helicase [Halopenitus malekzadehii]|uniref:DEAD/DEAH box helicase n=2 Tax=Halopenitus malekzadehii TaxID=1267564 RepID=A0A1H6J7R7_9EURY|nr:DEAD/DEAH box helicase [Halopenitus malekzadehii]
MHSPQRTLDSAIDRAAEITWWNRQMTRLDEVVGEDEATSFVRNETVEQKGPYVEFVDAPKFHTRSAVEFLGDLDYSDELINAIVDDLFDGDSSGSLYEHQAETIESISADSSDNVLAVPTATGKTESFFFPILDHCISTDEPGLKSLIIYPMKTLGVDQLNRFISYLDRINRHRDPEDRITIGIWDSDTPTRIGTREHEIEEGSYVRGLECPREAGEKLRMLGDMTVGTEDNKYSWIRVTRDAIRNGADILLTNPEALDHMFVSNNSETRQILGEDPGQHPVEHVVFDEAHIWSGISGASVRLLSERLKSFYAERDPQITMVSATVDNPRELAHKLTGTPEAEINSIDFTPRKFSIQSSPSFDRFAPCDLGEVAAVLALADLGEFTPTDLAEAGLGDAYETVNKIGLVSVSAADLVTLPTSLDWVRNPIADEVDELLADNTFDSVAEIASTEAGQNHLAETLLKTGGLDSEWFDFVSSEVPEAAAFASWFDEGTTGDVGFRHYDGLLAELADEGVDETAGVLDAVMAFGRLAGMVTEKYHVFLKPPTQAYLCECCSDVTRDKHCTSCDTRNAEIQFCKRCHYPFVEYDTDDDEEHFRPFDQAAPVDDCPGCGQWPRLTDIGVPTTSLLSYMLTEICRTSPSKKTLVFSDSHSAAESVGDSIIGTEYGLMAETLYVQHLIENGGSAGNYEAFRAVADELREAYWEPLIQNEIDEDGTAYNFLRTLLDDIEAHAMLHNAENLLDSALVTAESVTQFDDPVERVVAHEAYKLFVKDPRVGFSKNTIEIEGLSLPKIAERISSRSGYDTDTVHNVLPDVLDALLDDSIVVEQSWEEVRQTIANANVSEDRKEETVEYVERVRDEFNEAEIRDEESETGILTRVVRRDKSTLTLLERASFCTDCYRSYPIGDASLSACPDCGTPIESYQRFTRDEDGMLVADPGYADVDSGWSYAVDHWAHDVTTPIRNGADPEFISVGIHKGNVPHTLRGAIEEGFRKDDPDVNIVSATPTMELGVDIGSLDTVAQVGIPPTLTNYVQRSGRTGRTRGSSSLVATAIRGEHPVDGHYYGNLEMFLDDFEPVRVPDPYEFEELLAGHIVTETFAYLARNPHPSNVFERKYLLNETNQNLDAFVHSVEESLDILQEFLLAERREALERHLQSIFGQQGIDAFESVFVDSGPLSMPHRIEKTFSQIISMSGSAETNKAFTESNNRLDQWLGRLGYLANYRSFGQQFPVKFSGRSEGIEFEGSGRLYDMFPGPENDLGSLVTLHGTDYIVDDVRGSSTPLTTVMVCTNEDCERPFESYELDTERCPYCDTPLEETNVHGVSSVECKPARGGQKRYNTQGLMTTAVSDSEIPPEKTASMTVFGLDCEASYGELDVTDFVYAYERRHSASPDKSIFRSQALIERDPSSSSPDSGKSWEDRLEESETEEYAPVGQQYHTQGLTLEFGQKDVAERLDVAGDDAIWPQALVSLKQALEKAIAVVAQCERTDFRVDTDKTESTITVRVVDSRQGGNGIAWQVWNALDDIQARVGEVADCDRCEDFCDECLLLSRTPAYYLENDLLDNQVLSALTTVPSNI